MSTSPGAMVLWTPPPFSPQASQSPPPHAHAASSARAATASPGPLSPWFAALTGCVDPVSPLALSPAYVEPMAVDAEGDEQDASADVHGIGIGMGMDGVRDGHGDDTDPKEDTSRNADAAVSNTVTIPISPPPPRSIFGAIDLTHVRINSYYLALLVRLPPGAPLPVPFPPTAQAPAHAPSQTAGASITAIDDEDVEMRAADEDADGMDVDDDDGLVSSLPPIDLDPGPEMATEVALAPVRVEQLTTHTQPHIHAQPRKDPIPNYLRPDWPPVVEPDPEPASDEEDAWRPRKPVGRFVMPSSAPNEHEVDRIPITSVPGLVNLIQPRTHTAPATEPNPATHSNPVPPSKAATHVSPVTHSTSAAAAPATLSNAHISATTATHASPHTTATNTTARHTTASHTGVSPTRASTPPAEPVPQPEARPKNVIPKTKITLARKTPPREARESTANTHTPDAVPEQPEPYEQWRVGKTPGHQGSHARSKRTHDAVGDDEKYDSTKVLKRPFRPPTRIASVVVKKVPHVAVPSSPPSTSSVPSSPPSKSSTTSTTSASSSSTSASSRSPSTRAKPFRPLTRSAAPSPTSSAASARHKSVGKLRLRNLDPDAELVAALENRIRTLKAALKYVSNDDEDERLVRLVRTWREAGREVADRLFALLPEPPRNDTSGSWGGAAGSWGWGWDDELERHEPEPASREAVQYFLDAATNAKGESVDEDGVPLLGTVGDEPDLVTGFIDPPSTHNDIPMDRTKEDKNTPWDRGAMLLRLGVDPALLGFDADADDWEDIDDE